MNYRCNDCGHRDTWAGSHLVKPRCRKCESTNISILSAEEVNEVALQKNQVIGAGIKLNELHKSVNELHKRVNSLSGKDLVMGVALAFLTWQIFSLSQKVEKLERVIALEKVQIETLQKQLRLLR